MIKTLPQTYWERSPSGTGLHGIFRSKGGLYLDKHPGSIVEAYSERHFMSCTGWVEVEAELSTLRTRDIKLLCAGRTAPRGSAVDEGDSGNKTTRGGRHQALLRYAGSLIRSGADMGIVECAMREYNVTKFDPPLEEKEMLRMVRSASRFKTCAPLLSQETKDIGNADRLLLFGQGDLRYVPAYKRWVVWDGQRWPVEDHEQEEVRLTAHAMIRAYGLQAAEAPESQRERHLKFAAESGNSARIANLLREAQPHATLTHRRFGPEPATRELPKWHF
jgi:hypothetical protein